MTAPPPPARPFTEAGEDRHRIRALARALLASFDALCRLSQVVDDLERAVR